MVMFVAADQAHALAAVTMHTFCTVQLCAKRLHTAQHAHERDVSHA